MKPISVVVSEGLPTQKALGRVREMPTIVMSFCYFMPGYQKLTLYANGNEKNSATVAFPFLGNNPLTW